MGSIVLSAAVRQNLLSLQQTAGLMAQTQNNLSTGNKVNSALDNPTNFFTAQGLNNRGTDISNLLDGISNGIQVIQAANTGITSVQSLVSQAKSIANQALQTSIGYSQKSSVASAAITGATAADLRGTSPYANGTILSYPASNDSSVNGGKLDTTAALVYQNGTDSVQTTLDSTDSITINGKTIQIAAGTGTNTASASGATVYAGSSKVSDLIQAVNTVAGYTALSLDNSTGRFTINSGTTSSGITIAVSSHIQSAFSFGADVITGQGTTTVAHGDTIGPSGVTFAGVGTAPTNGKTLTIPSVNGGTATSITFGDGTGGTVKTLDQLNTALSANNLQATLDSTGVLTITTTNDNASATIGTIGGTAFSSASGAFYNKTVSAPVADATSQATRTNLVNQYNALLTQIDQTSADASFNGVNLLAGDQLQLTFNETGKSKLSITGVNFSSAGLGLSSLASTAFKDNAATNAILTQLNSVTSTLRSQASALGSNLSVVQTRQDFNKNLINVLQTGSANLTQADINLEAANSQALSTRQSLSVSALSLANQSQQSVLQLLR